MPTDVQIANRALSRLGDLRVTSLAGGAGAKKTERAMADCFALVRQEVLREHPWNCALRRDTLSWTQQAIVAPGITSATQAVVSVTAHGRSVGDYVRFDDVLGMSQINGMVGKIVVASNPNDFTVDIDTTTFSAWSSGGTVTLVPAWAYANLYALPSTPGSDYCLRVLEVEGQENDDWTTEGRNLLIDADSPIKIWYIRDLQTYDDYDALLVSAFAARLAVEVAEELTNSSGKRQLAWEEYTRILQMAKGADAREQTPSAWDEDDWILSREFF